MNRSWLIKSIFNWFLGNKSMNSESHKSLTDNWSNHLTMYSSIMKCWNESCLIILYFSSPTPNNPMENTDFMVVQTPSDTSSYQTGSGSNTPMTNHSSAASTPSVHLAPGQIALAQTGRGTSVVSTGAPTLSHSNASLLRPLN